MRHSELFPKLFLDCDGVLADFNRKAVEIFGMTSHEAEEEHGAKYFWQTLTGYNENGLGFFESLEPMPDAHYLYNAVKHLNPTILTGAPNGDWAEPQKRNWASKHFPNAEMIVCLSKDKRNHMKRGDIIIDDMDKHKHLWEENGGYFIIHTSAKDSIKQLKKLEPIFFERTDSWTPPK